ncbi:ankyrin repeat-containing domain protein [Blakeslea trispora]|nr:ankyrin repeat-containing domain protein [Blakeslea trispora]
MISFFLSLSCLLLFFLVKKSMMSQQKHEDYYQELSLPPVPHTPKDKKNRLELDIQSLIAQVNCTDLQSRLQTSIDKLVTDWTDRYNTLINILNELEQQKAQLEQRLHMHLRENQVCHKYQQRSLQGLGQALYPFQRRSSSATHSSNASLLSSSSGRSSSCSSSIYTSLSVPEEANSEMSVHPNLSLLSSASTSSSTASSIIEHHELNQDMDTYASILSDDMSSSVNRHSSISSSSNNSLDTDKAVITTALSQVFIQPIEDTPSPDSPKQYYSLPTIEYSEKILTFACGDGFWNTIAKGRSNKAEVDTLVGNYLRRGGKPDVAKNSETVKDVKEGYSLIHALVAVKNTAALQKIIEAGAKTNIYPLTYNKEDWFTPLMLAVKSGYVNGADLILKAGETSLFEDRGPSGETALHVAIQSGSEEMILYVLKITQYALLEKADLKGATPLHYACMTGKSKLATLLIREFQCQSDPKDNKGETPLHYAVRNRKLKVITKLVSELGVCPNPYVLKQTPTPLDLAKSGGLNSIADGLKALGAKTTKEMEKSSRTTASVVASSGSSVVSSDSNASNESTTSQATIGVRSYLKKKTSWSKTSFRRIV